MLLNSLSVVSQLAKVSIEILATKKKGFDREMENHVTNVREYNVNIKPIKFDKSYVNVNHVEPTNTVHA